MRQYVVQTPNVGDRVIVRRQLGDAQGYLTDVIGHVLSVEPLVVRPQSVGGLESSAEAVAIDGDSVVALRVLPARRVRNSDIRAVEVATAKAFPGLEHVWCGGWLLRAGDGITERSNSAAPLGHSAGFEPVPVEEIVDFYARHSMTPRIMLPDRIGRPAESLCVPPRWRRGPEISVMVKDLEAAQPPQLEGVEFRCDEQPDEEWMGLYHFRGKPLPAHALELLRHQIDGVMGFGRLLIEGRTVAITRGTVTSSDDGCTWLGFSAVEVAEGFRRRGLGTHLCSQMLAWGHAQGAGSSYLQVISSNVAGIGLYDALGFYEHHRHRYAELVVGGA